MADELMRLNVRGASRGGKRASATARAIDDILADELEQLGGDATTLLRAFAPDREHHRVRKGVVALPVSRGGRITLTITGSAVDPETGFDYFNVTRFGHRKRIIRPRRAKRLVFQSLGRRWVLPYVRGYRPTNDWVELARPYIDRSLTAASRRVGRRIGSRLFR